MQIAKLAEPNKINFRKEPIITISVRSAHCVIELLEPCDSLLLGLNGAKFRIDIEPICGDLVIDCYHCSAFYLVTGFGNS